MRYKLLKDIKWVDKWEIATFEEDKDLCGWLALNSSWEYIISTNWKINEILVWFVRAIWIHPEWFEEIKEVKSIYDLGKLDEYYIITHYCEIEKHQILHWLSVDLMYNTFLTKEEAETELQKRKAMATIKKWSHDNDWGYDFKMWFTGWGMRVIAGILEFSNVNGVKTINNQYYSSEEIAEQALKELEAEYNILFNIKQWKKD